MTGKHKQRGFSLIEAAIVLAVVGLVIGGIWVATSSVIEKWKAYRLSEALLKIDQGARNLFPSKLWPSDGGGQTSITSLLISSGDVPKDMVQGSNVIANIISPEGKITMSLLYPPLTMERFFYYHLSAIKNVNTANQFLSNFVQATKKLGRLSNCFCIRCEICDGSHNIDRWDYNSGIWPPACPKPMGTETLHIACYIKE